MNAELSGLALMTTLLTTIFLILTAQDVPASEIVSECASALSASATPVLSASEEIRLQIRGALSQIRAFPENDDGSIRVVADRLLELGNPYGEFLALVNRYQQLGGTGYYEGKGRSQRDKLLSLIVKLKEENWRSWIPEVIAKQFDDSSIPPLRLDATGAILGLDFEWKEPEDIRSFISRGGAKAYRTWGFSYLGLDTNCWGLSYKLYEIARIRGVRELRIRSRSNRSWLRDFYLTRIQGAPPLISPSVISLRIENVIAEKDLEILVQSGLPKLKRLSLHVPNAGTLRALLPLAETLEELQVGVSHKRPERLLGSLLSQMRRLRALRLYSPLLMPSVLQQLASLPNLKDLTIHFPQITSKEGDALTSLRNISNLTLELGLGPHYVGDKPKNEIDDTSQILLVRSIRELKQLQTLEVVLPFWLSDNFLPSLERQLQTQVGFLKQLKVRIDRWTAPL